MRRRLLEARRLAAGQAAEQGAEAVEGVEGLPRLGDQRRRKTGLGVRLTLTREPPWGGWSGRAPSAARAPSGSDLPARRSSWRAPSEIGGGDDPGVAVAGALTGIARTASGIRSATHSSGASR